MDNNVQGLLGVSMEKIKEMADANTVIGEPITMADGTVLIPVSKVSYGFAAGGSDLPSKSNAALFGGGSGAGIHITPVAFLVVANGDVRLLSIAAKPDTSDKLLNLVPGLVEKVTELVDRKKDKTTVKTTVQEDDVTVETETTKKKTE